MKLRPIQGKNGFCGPAAVSAITGCRTEISADLMRQHYGRSAIKGSFANEIGHALRQLGFSLQLALEPEISVIGGRTYAQWCRNTARSRGRRTFLLAYGHHWAVVQGRRHFCSQRKQGCAQRLAPMRRGRVTQVFEVFPTSIGALVNVQDLLEAKKATPVQRANQAARARAKALLRAHPDVMVNVERLDGGTRLDVWCSLFSEDQTGDPFEGDHYVDDWCEALPRIQAYTKLLTAL
jgi:hypothetical protein